MTKGKPKLLTIKMPLDYLVELAVAADILRAKSVSGMMYAQAMRKIEEAKLKVSPEEFQTLFERKRSEIIERSEQKSRERAAARKEKQLAVVVTAKSAKRTEVVKTEKKRERQGNG